MNVGNWGRWGEDDERGALNTLTSEVVLAATRVCKTGKVYRLALPLRDSGVPIAGYRGAPRRLTLLGADDDLLQEYGATPGTGACEDVFVLASHSATHMDALCHVFWEGSFYNGFPAASFKSYSGAAHCGIEKNGGFAGRAVLLDVAATAGVPWLEPGHVISRAELADCVESEGLELTAGDVVLVRTGWLEMFLGAASRGEDVGKDQPGVGADAAAFLASHDVSAVGADNVGIECKPNDHGIGLGVHIELLVKHGITLIENLWLAEMSADRCFEAFFAVGPLLIPGATGSPVNPIAIG